MKRRRKDGEPLVVGGVHFSMDVGGEKKTLENYTIMKERKKKSYNFQRECEGERKPNIGRAKNDS